jgi:hypothetical protein
MRGWLTFPVVMLLAVAVGDFAWRIYWQCLDWQHREAEELGAPFEAEGKQYGLGKSSNACIDESLTRADRVSGSMSKEESLHKVGQVKEFLRGCLQTAATDPALCEGVPVPSEFALSAMWQNNACAAHGRPNDRSCAELLRTIEEMCDTTP